MIADIAKKYVETYGMKLVTIPPKKKFSNAEGWDKNVITNSDQAHAYYTNNPDCNMGVLLDNDGFCSLDIDCIESAKIIFEEIGIGLDELAAIYPTIQGNPASGFRVMFRQPAEPVGYAKLSWPVESDRKKHYAVFELRGSNDGAARQDVLPPSIHPDTNQPYAWITEPPATLE